MIYLNLTILSISLNNLQSWVLAKELFQHKFMLDYIQIPWHFLFAPFFYMFLIHYLEIVNKSLKILRLILPLFFVAILLQVSFVLLYSGTTNVEKLNFIYEKYTSIEEIFSFIISIGVFSYAFYVLYKKENLFPKILSFDNLRWIYLFFIIGSIGYLLWCTALIIKVKMNFTGFIFSYYPLRIYTTLLIFWLGYQSAKQFSLLKERRSLRAVLRTSEVKDTITIEEKYEEEFTIIHNYILSNKKFTESKITREILAEELGMSKSKFSTIMNSSAQKSFIEYMNELRVKQAKKLLTDSNYNQYTITAVGLESGFKSRSTFYTVFKKHTGKTPAEFRAKK
ncbi:MULTISPECIES: helix-turn-helix transcriptional regulator [Tenacibaculum]|uniref:helix-turn-helix transcriptional regulator n=1 Tax=Tenacibaculum TaxID=104267 RepID=UPI001F0B2FFB|nr:MULTISPECIES: helix-turn-helix transcriptional regulator [Tenacibaculum]MCH3882435.1 helix-turn-helix transcriptional regulator [Tenacibaculum aquimarinum]MDO6600083.1 helix-turn-helix transcriptional regulator [Tenacibaculum sp. 1_MG-2023]